METLSSFRGDKHEFYNILYMQYIIVYYIVLCFDMLLCII